MHVVCVIALTASKGEASPSALNRKLKVLLNKALTFLLKLFVSNCMMQPSNKMTSQMVLLKINNNKIIYTISNHSPYLFSQWIRVDIFSAREKKNSFNLITFVVESIFEH